MTAYAQPRQPSPVPHGYELIRPLGGGATADVLLCRPRGSGGPGGLGGGPGASDRQPRPVAVKLGRRTADDEGVERFRMEAAFLARLSRHPHILTILGSGVTADGRPFLTLEYAPHGSLRDLLAKRTLSPTQAMDLGVRLAGALLAAHRAGITHRDIKPSNVLIGVGGRPMLADFGIAAGVYDGGLATGFSTPWAAPEVIAGRSGGGEAADLYALAAVLYASLAGRSPYEYGYAPRSEAELEQCVLERPLPRLDRPDVPPALSRTLCAALSKEPERRPFSALEFARELQRIQGAMCVPVTPLIAKGVPELPARLDAPRATDNADAARSSSRTANRRAAHAAQRKRRNRSKRGVVGIVTAVAAAVAILFAVIWAVMPHADSVPAPGLVNLPGPQVDEPEPDWADPSPDEPAWPDPEDIMPDNIPTLPNVEPEATPSPEYPPSFDDVMSIAQLPERPRS